MTPTPSNVTALLRAWSDGDREAQDHLFRAVYNELHQQAARYLRREHPGLSLQTTDLIHEAYHPQPSQIVELRLFGGLSVEETARVLDVSERTVKRDWNVAKAWLRQELSRRGQAGVRKASDT